MSDLSCSAGRFCSTAPVSLVSSVVRASLTGSRLPPANGDSRCPVAKGPAFPLVPARCLLRGWRTSEAPCAAMGTDDASEDSVESASRRTDAVGSDAKGGICPTESVPAEETTCGTGMEAVTGWSFSRPVVSCVIPKPAKMTAEPIPTEPTTFRHNPEAARFAPPTIASRLSSKRSDRSGALVTLPPASDHYPRDPRPTTDPTTSRHW